jgi:hypothetical protein
MKREKLNFVIAHDYPDFLSLRSVVRFYLRNCPNRKPPLDFPSRGGFNFIIFQVE